MNGQDGVGTAPSHAVVLEHFGVGPEIRMFSTPPAPPGGMIVAVNFAGVCGTDLHLRAGDLAVPVPLVLGHEGLGVIAELGPEANEDADERRLEVGDRVMWASSIACGRCEACERLNEPTLCANRLTYGVNRSTSGPEPLAGSWAEHICLCPGTTVVKMPPDIEGLAAMAFACAGPTMVHALQGRRPIRIGETVVVQGSGPVGLAAAALAELSGAASVIVVGGGEERLNLAARAGIGSHHLNIVDAASADEVIEKVMALTGGRGADLVVECTGSPAAIRQGITMARRGGAYLVVGHYTDSGDTTINPHQIVYRQLDLFGSWAFAGSHLVEYIRLLPALAARFDLPSLVTTYPLVDFARALEDIAAGSVMKAVLCT